MISRDLTYKSAVLIAIANDGRSLSPDECRRLAYALAALANRVAVMEDQPVPEFRRRSWPGRPGFTVIDGGAA
jgi:hypothetical protein